MLSQCYDGASVMSGKRGGVTATIQNRLNKVIPYVHCFNHRLHLIAVKVISEVGTLKQFFDVCISLHEFFQHVKVAEKGKSIVRLLE